MKFSSFSKRKQFIFYRFLISEDMKYINTQRKRKNFFAFEIRTRWGAKKSWDEMHGTKKSSSLWSLIRSCWSLATLDVGGEVDLVGQLRDVDLEAVLYLVQDLGVALVRDEGDGEALENKMHLLTTIQQWQ